MKITAICNTFRRTDLLEESLQSFLMQDYAGDKELIILNDESEQKLSFKHPQVRVINMDGRAPNLATKHNYAVSVATGDLIVPWDDDDIFLAHRLTTISQKVNRGIWYTDNFYTDKEDCSLQLTSGKIHCNHAFTKEMFIRFGAYNDSPDISFDFIMMNSMRGAIALQPDTIKPSYIYRKKSTTSANYSDMYTISPSEMNEKHAEANSEFKSGSIELNPHWSRNWQVLADEALEKNPVPIPLHVTDKSYKEPIISQEQLDKSYENVGV